ncbi:Rieske (2Fe-2S) protein [Pseudomonas viciae]|uniref:Rieske (2Fe-2S) protein n=1 Tax=Pseudomonas viciae TaxID=2505979 RepID=A0A4P7PML2_9PSED|nr:Rieske 2Fe-2S domain-containing protein [Pseudomonas viciae]QBZ91613.1 Rieske (2Fe-2S) protein [Pseudomonas viciae]
MSLDALALCRLDELLEGQARGFDPLDTGKDSVFALRHGGEVRVYRNSCPHLQVRLEYRKDRFLSVDGSQIVCYAHGARFLPDSGLCIYGPCLGESLSALQWHAEADWLVLEAGQLEACAPESTYRGC